MHVQHCLVTGHFVLKEKLDYNFNSSFKLKYDK